jgi:arginyl-tRNA synthetase
MPPHYNPLHRAAASFVARVAGVDADDLKVETPRAELGDVAVACFPIGRARGVSPAQVAQELAAAFEPEALLATATAQGPFLNFRANRPAVLRELIERALGGSLIPRDVGAGKTVCIDYSSPNISKHLAYHHLRGTMIGHALVQILRALGYRVIGTNFLGDWGTTHGKLLAAWHRWGPAEPLDVTTLNALYVRFSKLEKENPAVEGEGRAWFKRLEEGDPEARALWEEFRAVSWAEFEDIYKLLGIEFEEVRGESVYEPEIPRVMKEFEDKGLVETSEGALVVFLEGETTPILLRKLDGTTLYATRDVASMQYHWATYGFTRSLYVVGREQSLHFRQLFKLLKKAGHDWGDRCKHVPYGHVRVDGKKTGTRLGNVVLMRHVFDIMQDTVRPRIVERNPERPPEELEATARAVGIGAVVFTNLASQREKDIDFDQERATSMDGDSGPYLQYAHARCASIARKAGVTITGIDGVDPALLAHDAEWELAKRLLELPDVVASVVRSLGEDEATQKPSSTASDCEPHLICHYLLEVAAAHARWYTLGNGDPAVRVICEDAALQRARLALTAATQAVMAQGLGLLGITAPDWM